MGRLSGRVGDDDGGAKRDALNALSAADVAAAFGVADAVAAVGAAKDRAVVVMSEPPQAPGKPGAFGISMGWGVKGAIGCRLSAIPPRVDLRPSCGELRER